MKHKLASRIIGGLLTLVFICGCAPSTPTMTLRFKDREDKCIYKGPKSLSSEAFTVYVLPGEDDLGAGFSIVTLEPGKTMDDLNAYPYIHPPEWVNVLVVNQLVTGDQLFTYDLTTIESWKQGEPLYLVCFRGDGHGSVVKINTVGPINIEP